MAARIPDEIVSRIYEETYLPDLIGEYSSLKQRGRKNGEPVFVGLSPFNKERTPSTYVFFTRDGRWAWKDHSSGKGGVGPASFLTALGLPYRAALESLAERLGIDISEPDHNRNMDPDYVLRRYLAAAKQRLLDTETAMQYLRQRGISRDDVESYGIGLGFETRLHPGMKAAGLTTENGYQMFPGRMIFPIYDFRNRMVGVTGRQIPGIPHRLAGKWVNSPQTPAHQKGVAFSGVKGWLNPGKGGSIVATEGPIDVIPLGAWGMSGVCVNGKAMSSDQVVALSRRTSVVDIAFDRDKAGIKATPDALKLILGYGLDARYVKTEEGYDLGEYLPGRPLHGKRPEVWPWPRFFQELYERDYGDRTIQFRSRVIATVSNILATMPQETRIPAMDWMRENWHPIEPGTHQRAEEPPPARQASPTSRRSAEYAILVAYLAASEEERCTIEGLIDFELADKEVSDALWGLMEGGIADNDVVAEAEADSLLHEMDMNRVVANIAFARKRVKANLLQDAMRSGASPETIAKIRNL